MRFTLAFLAPGIERVVHDQTVRQHFVIVRKNAATVPVRWRTTQPIAVSDSRREVSLPYDPG